MILPLVPKKQRPSVLGGTWMVTRAGSGSGTNAGGSGVVRDESTNCALLWTMPQSLSPVELRKIFIVLVHERLA